MEVDTVDADLKIMRATSVKLGKPLNAGDGILCGGAIIEALTTVPTPSNLKGFRV